MTDILARQRQLIATTAQWAANDLIIGDGELALERTASGVIRQKIGNGVDTYSELPFNPPATFGTDYTWRAAASLISGGTRTSPDHPIMVACNIQHSSSNGACSLTIDGIAVCNSNNGGNGEMITSYSAIVPPLTDYVITWSALTALTVSELRAD